MKKYIIGVDLGGTKVATVLADTCGSILARAELPTEAARGQDAVINNIFQSVDMVLAEKEVRTDEVLGLGIGSPGPLDAEAGIVLEAPNLGWKDVPIRDILQERYMVPAYLENDANAAGLAEQRFGAGRGAKYLLYVTVSTGVGGGIILDGSVYHGAHGIAGEIGHIAIDSEGPACNCGSMGCLEAFASGTGLVRRTIEAIKSGAKTKISDMVDGDLDKITAVTIAEAANEGDGFAIEMYKSVGRYLGVGLASIINFMDPDVIVIGGGLTKSADLFFDEMRKTIDERAFKAAAEKVKILQAELGGDVGTLGAVAVVMDASGIKC